MTENNLQSERDRWLALAKTVSTFSPPLYILVDKRPELVSSCTLLKWENSYFLVTCAHTFKNFGESKIGVIVDRKFWTIGGHHAVTNIKPIENDKLDLGLYNLDQETVKILTTRFSFFDLKSTDIDHGDSDGDDYLVIGHAITRTKIRHDKRKIFLKPFVLKTNLNYTEKLFTLTGTRSVTNLLLTYQRSKLRDLESANIVKGPLPNGLSGCPVWKISTTNDQLRIDFSGIIIEYYQEHNILIGTRTRIVSECLRQIFEIEIPTSTLIRVNLRNQ